MKIPHFNSLFGRRVAESKETPSSLQAEAKFFGQANNALMRSVGWGAIPYFQQQIGRDFDIAAPIDALMKDRPNVKALSLACGTMAGEYVYLKHRGATEIDAYDISEGQRDKFYETTYDGEVDVNYQICDVNEIELPADEYDIVFIQHAYHHLVEVEHVARQINKSLKTSGVFVLIDYIGLPFLQRTEKQLRNL